MVLMSNRRANQCHCLVGGALTRCSTATCVGLGPVSDEVAVAPQQGQPATKPCMAHDLLFSYASSSSSQMALPSVRGFDDEDDDDNDDESEVLG